MYIREVVVGTVKARTRTYIFHVYICVYNYIINCAYYYNYVVLLHS